MTPKECADRLAEKRNKLEAAEEDFELYEGLCFAIPLIKLYPELVEALREIGNIIGAPVMSYRTAQVLLENEEKMKRVSKIVIQALAKAKEMEGG